MPGYGWYERDTNPRGALLPTEITEFTNAGMIVGPRHREPVTRTVHVVQRFLGCVLDLWLIQLSQVRRDAAVQPARPGLRAQGRQGALGGRSLRSGDGRGLADALRDLRARGDATLPGGQGHRPAPVGVQRGARGARRGPRDRRADRRAAPDAARDRAARPRGVSGCRAISRRRAAPTCSVRSETTLPAMGTVFVQGTTTTANLVKALPDLDNLGLNVKVVAAISPQLFRLQPAAYRDSVIAPADRLDAMAITNRTVKLMRDWVDGPLGAEYSMGADWDNRWRTGGSVDEVMDEAHLTTPYIVEGIDAVRPRPREPAPAPARPGHCGRSSESEGSPASGCALTRGSGVLRRGSMLPLLDVRPTQRVRAVSHCGGTPRGVHREAHLLAEVAIVVALDDGESPAPSGWSRAADESGMIISGSMR